MKMPAADRTHEVRIASNLREEITEVWVGQRPASTQAAAEPRSETPARGSPLRRPASLWVRGSPSPSQLCFLPHHLHLHLLAAATATAMVRIGELCGEPGTGTVRVCPSGCHVSVWCGNEDRSGYLPWAESKARSSRVRWEFGLHSGPDQPCWDFCFTSPITSKLALQRNLIYTSEHIRATCT